MGAIHFAARGQQGLGVSLVQNKSGIDVLLRTNMANDFNEVKRWLAEDPWSGEGILWPRRHGRQSYGAIPEYELVPDAKTCDDELRKAMKIGEGCPILRRLLRGRNTWICRNGS